MKVKVILFGLVLFGILFCLPNQNQARRGPPYFDPIDYPNEHPWQDSDSPLIEDEIITPQKSSVIWIMIVPTKITIIRLSQTKPEVMRPTKVASRIDLGCSTK
ncbi:MAG: hypothetical protein KAW52_09050 [candidate division Zixibacteria bacterium]|nr:hypothetical protein [candidate division Zixibacteria bacterium]